MSGSGICWAICNAYSLRPPARSPPLRATHGHDVHFYLKSVAEWRAHKTSRVVRNTNSKAIIDSRICAGAACWRSRQLSNVQLYWHLENSSKYNIAFDYTQWSQYKNITSSVKPEVHNVLQRRQKMTKPRPQATCTKIWWSSAKLCERTGRQTNRPTHHNKNYCNNTQM